MVQQKHAVVRRGAVFNSAMTAPRALSVKNSLNSDFVADCFSTLIPTAELDDPQVRDDHYKM
jgi:hypothetical protein